MKHLKALCSILVLGFIIFLCSCGSELPAINGDFTVTVFKNAIEVNATFVDTEAHDLYYDNVRPYVVVENENEDGEVTEVSRNAVTVTKPTVVEDPNGKATSETYTHEGTTHYVYLDSSNNKYFTLTDASGDKYIYYLTTDTEGNTKVKESKKITGIPTELSATKVTVSGLTQGSEYTVKLIITAGSKQAVLKTDVVTTLDSGESSEDPIIINTLQELVGMNKDSDAYYKLGADIKVDGSLSTIFNSSTQFKGHFDGDGHTISGFTLSGNNYAGLFGYMFGATVENLTLKDVKFNTSRGETFLGSLAGYAKNCTVKNVKVENADFTYSGRSSSMAIIGGLIGEAENSTITNCSVDVLKVNISSAQLKVKVGGFVGLNDLSLIDNCHVNGTIESTIAYSSNKDGRLFVGGFAGVNDSNRGIINCSSVVSITVKEPQNVSTSSGLATHKIVVGGFVGGNETFHNRVNNCVAIGDITVEAKHSHNVFVGGFVGDVCSAGVANLENCLYKAKENGISLTLMVEPEVKEGEEAKEIEQVAYVSMTIGRIQGEVSTVKNVIAYSDLLTITNEHAKVTKGTYVVSTDVAAFSEAIQKIILEN